MMTSQEQEFTTLWWKNLLQDEAKLIRFLQKLYTTEYSGYQDNRDAAEKYCRRQTTPWNVFHKTADDELYHADMLVDVLVGRGAWPIQEKPEESLYWTQMDQHVNSLETCAAVFHYGEQLAADRFELMLQVPETPEDIKFFLSNALPDEKMHARAFKNLSNEKALADIAVAHAEISARMRKT